jgi:hypothetical protein
MIKHVIPSAARDLLFVSRRPSTPAFRNLLETYSVCSTRRGALVAFDDACITSGLMITTPPCATGRSARSIPLARRRTSSSVSTPARCVRGRTRRGPKSVARNGHASAPGISRAIPIILSLAAICATQRSLIRRRTPARLLGRSAVRANLTPRPLALFRSQFGPPV